MAARWEVVCVESPYAPMTPPPEGCCQCAGIRRDCAFCAAMLARAEELSEHQRYVKAALLDCLRRGESPVASHVLLAMSGVLDDLVPEERTLGIEAGLAVAALASRSVVYADLGISRGMALGIDRARAEGRPVEIRRLGGEWAEIARRRAAAAASGRGNSPRAA